MTVFTYRPANCSDPSLLLVFHGVARNARSYRDYARPLADRNCLLLVAPLFDQRDFPAWRYQRGGIVKDGVVQNPSDWTGTLVLALVDWVRQAGGPAARLCPARPFGRRPVSGAARRLRPDPSEAHRRRQPGKLCVSQPGRCRALWAGQGLRGRRWRERNCGAISNSRSPSISAKADTRVDDRDDSPEARAQGASRHQRGVNAFNAARTLAQERGWTFNWRLVELPGVGHNAPKMFSAPQVADALAP